MELQVNIQKCIDTLETNLQNHIVEYNEAVEVWVEKVVKELNDFKETVTREQLKASHTNIYNLLHKKPQDNRSEYSKLLGALKLARDSGQEAVSIDEDDYDRMFNDNWDWRHLSKAANSFYKR